VKGGSKMKTKIDDLKISDKDKNLLKELVKPMRIALVAATIDTSYNYASTKLKVFHAKEWVIKIPPSYGRREIFYLLNKDNLDV